MTARKLGDRKRGAITQHPSTPEVPPAISGNAQRGSFKKGMEARKARKTLARANPYDPTRPTFERGLWRIWRQGFDYQDRLLGGAGVLDAAERWEATVRSNGRGH